MLTNAQKGLLKRAQAQAGLSDEDYRDALECVAGVRTSTAPALGDDHLDVLMSYIEAIHWRGVDAGALKTCCNPTAPFRQRGYWATKNTAASTSRDRWTGGHLKEEIDTLERSLMDTGVTPSYISAIRARVASGTATTWTPPQWRAYRAALERTLKARQKPRPARASH